MDSPYFSHFHTRQKGGLNTRKNGDQKSTRSSRTHVLLLEAAQQLVRRPICTACAVAFQGVRFQTKTVLSTAYLAVHPCQALTRAKDITLHPLESCKTALHTILGPVITVQETDAIIDQTSPVDPGYADFYDVERARYRLHELEGALKNDRPMKMLLHIRTNLTRLLCRVDKTGVLDPNPEVLERYTDAVCESLKAISKACEIEDHRLDRQYVLTQLKLTRQSLGRTALFLSGGGTLGMQHIGVIKALFDSGNLPRVVSGSSAGAIVCAVLCTKQDNEIKGVLDSFCNGDLKVFVGDDEEPGIWPRLNYLRKHGHLFNAENLRRVMKYHLGDLTFREAYNRTRRILNITVSSSSTLASSQLLNYASAGDVLIWSAVVASCALPFGYEPGPLMTKGRNGTLERFDKDTVHVDGSIEGDLPFEKVSTIFNVNGLVASQVNPHVTPFLKDQEESPSQFNSFRDAMVQLSKDEMVHWMRPGLLPVFSDLRRQVASIIDQRYTGDITILPKDTEDLLLQVLCNPTTEFMNRASQNGKLATLQMLSQIKSHVRIEVAIDAAVEKAEESIAFSKRASNLRRLELLWSGRLKRAGRGPRTSSTGSCRSTKSAVVHSHVQAPCAHQLTVRSMSETHFDILGNAATKVVGSSSSSSSRGSSLQRSDDEANVEGDQPKLSPIQAHHPLELEMESEIQETLSVPDTESKTFDEFCPSPRPRSPAQSIPVCLMMTSLPQDASSAEVESKQRRPDRMQPIPRTGSRKKSPYPTRSPSFERQRDPENDTKDLNRILKRSKKKRTMSNDV